MLEQIDDWPVDRAATALVDATGRVVATHGAGEQPFALASVTKLLTAYAALVAVEEGSIGLDAAAGPPGATIRHLLAHASGLAPDQPSVMAPPATRRIYSNAGFEALAAAVEQATGFAFADYLRGAVLEPLGMDRTALQGSPAHGATSTVSDLVRFVTEVQQPTLLARATVHEACSTQFPGIAGVLPGYGRQDPNDWGLGFERRATKQPHWTGTGNGPDTVGHFGRSGTFVWIDPRAGCGLIVLTDREFGPWAVPRWPVISDAALALAR